jgi:hypothetical protein
MKSKIFILVFILSLTYDSFTQTINYAYDASGNRVSREIVFPPIAKPMDLDSTQLNEVDSIHKNTNYLIDPIQSFTLKIYPNPTDGKLFIEILNMNNNQTGSVSLYNSNGQQIYLIENFKGELTQIDITSQSSGIYVMKVVIGDEIREWKIIKN